LRQGDCLMCFKTSRYNSRVKTFHEDIPIPMCSRQCPMVKMRTYNGLSIKHELHIFFTIQGPHQFMSYTGGVGGNTSLMPLKWARNDSKTCNLHANIATELISTAEGERAVSHSVCYVYTGRVKQLCCPYTYPGELGKDNILRCLVSIIKNTRVITKIMNVLDRTEAWK
jgi:hypothetical protein